MMNSPPWRDRSYRTRGRGGSRTWQKPLEVTPTPEPPFGALIKSIAAADLNVASYDGNEVVITDSELIASFNWIDSPEPTILVPGTCTLAMNIHVSTWAVPVLPLLGGMRIWR